MGKPTDGRLSILLGEISAAACEKADSAEGCVVVERVKALEEIDRLQDLCAQVYQVVGALAYAAKMFDSEQVVRVMDNLDAAAAGKVLPHKELLPFTV